MTTHGFEKSPKSWMQQLFNRTAPSSAAVLPKTYYAHCYVDHTVKSKSPFKAFFKAATSPYEPDLSLPPIAKTLANTELAIDDHVTEMTGEYLILNSYQETADTKTFRLGRENATLFNFLPGQYVKISVVISGQTYQRAYSLASPPTRNGTLDITVKKDPNGGLVSNWINDHLSVGDTVKLTGPFGHFSCAKCNTKKVLFLAAGSGIVPIMSMLRWLTDTEKPVDAILLLSFRTLDDIIYWDELNLIARRHKNIKLLVTLTTDKAPTQTWLGLTGRIDQHMLLDYVPDLPERLVYLCGPAAFMTECKQNLLQLNLPAEQLMCESFERYKPAEFIPRLATGLYQVSFVKSAKAVTTDGAISLLTLAEKVGVAIGQDCRSGHCGECMVKCLAGNIAMTDEAQIEAFDREKGWIYACCAYPASNIELDA